MGFSLNLVSLLAITLVTGILVDDAIVEIENIVRHMRMGKSPYRASIEAADEIGLAVIAITLTIVAVFAPVSFMGGIAGQYFKQFGLVVAAAVFFSLLVARLDHADDGRLFPARDAPPAEGRLGDAHLYASRRLARGAPFQSVAVGIMIFFGSIGAEAAADLFLPKTDTGRQLLAIELPPGRNATIHARSPRPWRAYPQRPDVRRCWSSAAISPGSGAETRKATITVKLVPKAERKLMQEDITGAIGQTGCLPDVRYWFLNDEASAIPSRRRRTRSGRRHESRSGADQRGQAPAAAGQRGLQCRARSARAARHS